MIRIKLLIVLSRLIFNKLKTLHGLDLLWWIQFGVHVGFLLTLTRRSLLCFLCSHQFHFHLHFTLKQQHSKYTVIQRYKRSTWLNNIYVHVHCHSMTIYPLKQHHTISNEENLFLASTTNNNAINVIHTKSYTSASYRENGLRAKSESYRESSGPSVIIVHRPESTQPLLLKQGRQFDLCPGGDVREHAQFAAASFLGWHGHGIQI